MSSYHARRPAALILVAALAFFISCDDSIVDQARLKARQLTIVEGDNQIAAAGATLPIALAVRVSDERGNAVPGVRVDWQLVGDQGGGRVGSPTGTDLAGIARAFRTLGLTTGAHSTTASVEGVGTQTFTSIATVQGATRIAPSSELFQSDTVGATLAPFRVRVTNHLDQPVAGVEVIWQTHERDRVLANTPTNQDGSAELVYTLGYMATESYGARAYVNGLNGSPVVFAATATAGRPVWLSALNSEPIGLVNSTVRLEVRADDAYGNRASAGRIVWSSSSSDAAIEPTASPEVVRYRLGDTEGVYTATATASNIPASVPVVFSTRAVSTLVGVSQSATGTVQPSFAPAHIAIAVGRTAGWVWQPRCYEYTYYYYYRVTVCENHNIVFEDDPNPPASSALSDAHQHFRTFTTGGRTIRFRCTNHSASFTEGMVGTVTVTDS